ncbi:MAG TPA: hypothetical protein EYH57_08460 [Sulfurovum sp.]|nr:hypothetical protein [Sulfurovum sp.]
MKILMMMLVMMTSIFAVDQNGFIVGQWQAYRKVTNKGTLTIEKEYLNLNANKTFSILILVSVEKGNAFVKDLQIKAFGTWKLYKDTLVYVVKSIDVPFAKEVYRISQPSLTQLANYFKSRFEGEPIRILKVQGMTNNTLTVINEEGVVTNYTR